jgi:hypothetical protein
MPPGRGLRPPGPPVCPPPWTLGSPASWVPLVAGLLMWATRPLLMFCGGTPPTTPCQGGKPPGPPLPTPVGLGFAGVREGGQGLGRKGTPSWLPFAHPRGLRVCQRSGAHSWRVKLSPDPAFARIPPSFAGKETKGPVLPGPPSLAGRVQGSTLSAEPGLLLQGFG